MYNPNERIIGATYVMQKNILDNVFNYIKTLIPETENVTNKEFAESVISESDNLSENAKRERIIGAATVMSESDARKVWENIMFLANIPEVTPEEAALSLDRNLGKYQG